MEAIEAIDRSVLHSHLVIRVIQEVISCNLGIIPTVFDPLLHILVVASKETN